MALWNAQTHDPATEQGDAPRLGVGPWVWQLWIVVPLLVVLSTVLSAWLVIRANQDATINQMAAQQADETELLAKLIASKVDQSQKVLSTVAEAAAPWALDAQPTLEWMLDQGPLATRYFDSLVFARNSQVFRLNFRSNSDAAAEVEPAERDLVRRVMVDGKPQVSEPFKSPYGGPSIALGMPLRDQNGDVQGAIAGVLRLQSQSLLPISLAVSPQDSSQLVVMTSGGVVISHPDPARILDLAMDEPSLAQALQLWSARDAPTGKPSARAWWREPQLISVAEMPAAHWLVVRMVQRDQGLPVWGSHWHVWWWLLAIPLVLAGLTWLWLWWHTQRLRALVAHLPAPPDDSGAGRGDELDQIAQHVGGLNEQNASTRQELLQQHRLTEGVLANARFPLLLLKNERIAQVSQALAHLLGYSRQDLHGQPIQMLAMVESDLVQMWGRLEPELQRHGSAEATLALRHQSGAPVAATVQLVRVPDASPGTLWCFVRAGQGRVTPQALGRVDSLTQLPNYEALLLHLTAMLQAQRDKLDGSSPSAPVLFYVNVDNMSAINALAGHAQGDLVLQHVARQLQLLQPFQGFVARVAGDKFALVLRQCSHEKADELAAQLCQALQNWQPELRGKHFLVTVSIGLLAIDAGFADALQAIRAADMACYDAKRHGGSAARWGKTNAPTPPPAAAQAAR